MTSLDQLKDRLQKLLATNQIKKGTVKAKMAEFFFLQGVMTDEDWAAHPYLTITLISGRSILDD
jgi:hypothetical protein